jgi:hypothetical protein
LTRERIYRQKAVMAGLHFMLLVEEATLRLYAFYVIVEQILRHVIMVDGRHYIGQP